MWNLILNMIQSYKDLIVWQKSIELVCEIYKLTDHYPRTELYGLTSQMRRAAVSIPSNIAEGRKRGTRRDFCRFLYIAISSASELDTQIIIAKKLSYGDNSSYIEVDTLLSAVLKMLSVMIRNMKFGHPKS